MTTVTARRRGGLWRHRDFRIFWIGETTSQVGSAVTGIALPLVAVETLHSSALVVTALTAGTWLPWLVLGLLAGGWVDRLPRRAVMLACDTVSLAAFVSVPVAAWLGLLSVPQLVAVALITGASAVFFKPAYTAYLPSVIDADDLPEGNAKLTGSASAAQIAGPGLGGAIVQLTGAASGLLADALSFAVSFVCLATLRTQETRRPRRAVDGESRPRLIREIDEGLRFVVGDRLLRSLIIRGALTNFFLTGMNALEVVFLVRTVGIGPGAVGAIFAVVSCGGLTGAIVARRLSQRWGSARAAVGAITLGLPFALLLPLTTRGFGVALWTGGLFIVDGCVVISNVMTASFFQTRVPGEMLGRVSAVMSTVTYSMMPAGALVAGALGTLLGVRGAMWVLCAGIVVAGLAVLATPMRSLRDFPGRAS